MNSGDGPAPRPAEHWGLPRPHEWVRRILISMAVVIAIVLVYALAAAFLPRWWAQRVGSQVDGSFAAGVFWGLFYGIVFTAVPILVAWQARRARFGWKAKTGLVLAALALAAPNLMTLGIVLGGGRAAHAGERILDVEAPAFRGASLGGALIGTAAAVALIALLLVARRRGQALETLRQARQSDDRDT